LVLGTPEREDFGMHCPSAIIKFSQFFKNDI